MKPTSAIVSSAFLAFTLSLTGIVSASPIRIRSPAPAPVPAPAPAPAPEPQLENLLGPLLGITNPNGATGAVDPADNALINHLKDVAEVVDRTDDTNYVGLITQNTTVVEARGILGPSICSLFNCTASPNGGPPNADPELVPRLVQFIDTALGTRLTQVLDGEVTTPEGSCIVGPLVCLLFPCFEPQISSASVTTTTVTRTATATATRTATRTATITGSISTTTSICTATRTITRTITRTTQGRCPPAAAYTKTKTEIKYVQRPDSRTTITACTATRTLAAQQFPRVTTVTVTRFAAGSYQV